MPTSSVKRLVCRFSLYSRYSVSLFPYRSMCPRLRDMWGVFPLRVLLVSVVEGHVERFPTPRTICPVPVPERSRRASVILSEVKNLAAGWQMFFARQYRSWSWSDAFGYPDCCRVMHAPYEKGHRIFIRSFGTPSRRCWPRRFSLFRKYRCREGWRTGRSRFGARSHLC